MSRARVGALTVIALIAVVASSSATWLTGTTTDAVLGRGVVRATGSQSAPGALALALVVTAAVIAAMATAVRLQRALAVVAALAALGCLVLVIRAVSDPGGVLGPLAAASAGRAGSLAVDGSAAAAAFAGVAGAGILVVAAMACLLSVPRWPAPSARYDSPGRPEGSGDDGGTSSGPRGEKGRSAWDDLSAGQDPTTGDRKSVV